MYQLPQFNPNNFSHNGRYASMSSSGTENGFQQDQGSLYNPGQQGSYQDDIARMTRQSGQNTSVQPYAGTAATFNQQPHGFSPTKAINQPSTFHPQRQSSNAFDPQQQHSNPSATSSSQPTMAAPLSQSPVNTQQAQTNNTGAAPTSNPQTPTNSNNPSTREQQRFALLLEINSVLLTEINRLHASNQGGAINTQQSLALKEAGQPDKMASDDYIQLLRRLQGNLAYMMPRTGQQTNAEGKLPPGPMFMQHPPQMPQLADKFEKLRELFPDWVGQDARIMAMAGGGATGSPAQQGRPARKAMQFPVNSPEN